MSAKETSRVFSIPPGVGFLETLVEALFGGKLVPGFRHTGDPLALADVTIYLPTRRAARALRDVLLRKLDGQSAILPVIRPLGEFDEEAALFDTEGASALDLAPADRGAGPHPAARTARAGVEGAAARPCGGIV